jgi:hypothetical protein
MTWSFEMPAEIAEVRRTLENEEVVPFFHPSG